MRRIAIGLAALCLIAFLRSFLEWLADRVSGSSRLAFNTVSLAYLVPLAGITTYLVMRREQSETLDSGWGQFRMFALNALLSTGAIYCLWEQQGFGLMFNEAAPESYPFPYRATIILLATWLSIVITLQMIGTVIVALKDARTNVYDHDVEPL